MAYETGQKRLWVRHLRDGFPGAGSAKISAIATEDPGRRLANPDLGREIERDLENTGARLGRATAAEGSGPTDCTDAHG